MNSFNKILISALFAIAITGCASKPIRNFQEQRTPDRLDGSPQTKESVKKSIIAGCIARKWNCREFAPGQIQASIYVREHHAEAGIKYDTDSYSIIYKDSDKLGYSEKYNTIHRNYNRWINNLNSAIVKAPSL